MNLSLEECKIITKALINARNLSETDGFKFEKECLDSHEYSDNKSIQEFYNHLLKKIAERSI